MYYVTPTPETDSYQNGDSRNLFLEYESDSETKGECYATIDGTSYTVLTRGQRYKNHFPNNAQRNDSGPSTSNAPADNDAFASHVGKNKSSFDFIQFCEESKIQISAIDYLKPHPVELKKLVDRCKGNATDANCSVMIEGEEETLTSGIFDQKDPIILATSPGQKPEPFYISLYINGCKLSNCIIDSGASDNVMPFSVAKALGLNLNKVHGRCYSMDAKQVPFLGQIKDAQVDLASHP